MKKLEVLLLNLFYLYSRYVPPHLRSTRGPGSEEKPFPVPQERGIIDYIKCCITLSHLFFVFCLGIY